MRARPIRRPPHAPLASLLAALSLSLALSVSMVGCTRSAAPTSAVTRVVTYPPAPLAAEPLPPRESVSADAYDSASAPEPVRGSAADGRLREALVRACAASGLEPDGRLAELALSIVETTRAEPPGGALVNFHAQRLGIADPTPQLWLATASDTAAIAPVIEQTVRDAKRAYPLSHCGAGALRERRGVVIGLALSQRMFSLRTPIPRESALGAPITIAGELAPGYHGPELAVTGPAGSVTRQPLGKARSFALSLQPVQPGEYTFELLANGPQGFTVIALFPVFVGVAASGNAPPPPSEPAEVDANAVTAKLGALIASERARRNLPPLRIDPRLVSIALAHSQDMVSHGFIAHSSKRSGDASDRVQRSGLKAAVVLENIGRAYSAAELHQGLMQSPGHRGNILHPDARELGIGVVAEREGERLAFIATMLFTQLVEPAGAPPIKRTPR